MTYSEFANKMSDGEYEKMSPKEKLQYIFDTEEGIFVPIKRMKDYRWLSRNFLIQNKNHLLAEDIISLLKIILE